MSIDEQIMSDGRPAYAWWNEIQMLRSQARRVAENNKRADAMFKVLGVVRWAVEQHSPTLSTDIHVRVKDMALLQDSWDEVLKRAELITEVSSAD